MERMPETSKLSERRVTRRGLGRIALASVAAMDAAQTLEGRQKYPSALDGIEDKVDLSAFDPILYTRKLHDTAPLRMTFRAKTRAEAERWRKDLRAKLLELMGRFPEKRAPLQARTLEVREFPGYRREKFVFRSQPGSAVLGYLLTPKTGKASYPAVIAIPGHGRGVDDIVGIDPQGRDRTVKVDYEYDYAVQIAEQGMAAVAIEPMAFGCRRAAATKAKGATATDCQPSAGAALLLGQTMIGWRSYDVVRTIDWIETRKELDRERVGCMGISEGQYLSDRGQPRQLRAGEESLRGLRGRRRCRAGSLRRPAQLLGQARAAFPGETPRVGGADTGACLPPKPRAEACGGALNRAPRIMPGRISPGGAGRRS